MKEKMEISRSSKLGLFLVVLMASLNPTYQQAVCYRTIDLVFVIDGSNSLGQENFELMIDTIATAVDALTFGADEARVGAVLYSAIISDFIDLTTDKAAFKSGVRNFQYPDESTFTNLGIDRAREIIDVDRRLGVPKVMMIVTDGRSSDRVKSVRSAFVASSRGIDIWAVGVGPQADFEELANITTDGENQTFAIDSFKQFPDRLYNLTREVCQQATVLPTFTIPTTTTPGPSGQTTESTTTTAPTTTTAMPTTAKPEPKIPTGREELEDLCENAPTVHGVGYMPYPDDCTRMIQCYTNQYTNKTLVVTRKCPLEQFWDQSRLACAPSCDVDCPYDKCKKLDDCDFDPWYEGPDAYKKMEEMKFPMEGTCDGYWTCNKGRSMANRCPPYHAFDSYYGCKPDKMCQMAKDSTCENGIGVCERLPVWENITSFAVVTKVLGFYPTACRYSNFSITECRCEIGAVDLVMQRGNECKPYHESNKTRACQGGMLKVPIQRLMREGTIAFKIRLNLAEPNFRIVSTSGCDNGAHLKIWGNDKGIHAGVGDKDGHSNLATVLFKNVTGELEVLVMHHDGLLTLGVTQDRFQHVTTVKASKRMLCIDCMHSFTFMQSTGNTNACPLNEADSSSYQLEMFNCKPQVSGIYDYQ